MGDDAEKKKPVRRQIKWKPLPKRTKHLFEAEKIYRHFLTQRNVVRREGLFPMKTEQEREREAEQERETERVLREAAEEAYERRKAMLKRDRNAPPKKTFW